MGTLPVFGTLGDPLFNTEAGVIDLPCANWLFSEAKAQAIAEIIMSDMNRHVLSGNYSAIHTEKAIGFVRLYFDPHENDGPMPSLDAMKRHAASFSQLFAKNKAEMKRRLPAIERELDASHKRSARDLEIQLQNMHSSTVHHVYSEA